MADPATRQRILDAALACFLADGYEAATVARIRERSGVSNGALFHHFASKQAIAEALYADAMAAYQQGLWAVLEREPESVEEAVRGVVGHLLEWVERHPELARFVYLRGHLEWDSPGGERVVALNRDLAEAFQRWMAPFVERGVLRVTSTLLITAIVTGPAHAVARRWLAGHLDVAPVAFADELAGAAAAGLTGAPAAPAGTPAAPAGSPAAVAGSPAGRTSPPAAAALRPPVPPRARLTLELLADDGSVVGSGRASAELAAPDLPPRPPGA